MAHTSMKATLGTIGIIASVALATTGYAQTRTVSPLRTLSSSISSSQKSIVPLAEAPLPKPPKCSGSDQALRFDGKSWICEVIGGLLVAHASMKLSVKDVKTCDTENTWGGAQCSVKDGVGNLKCPFGTLPVSTNAMNGYMLAGGSGFNDKFGGEYHIFCYSRPIKIAK